MQTARRQLGDEGEKLAEDFLKSKGFRILERQTRIGRLGEIDLVTIDPASPTGFRGTAPALVFIEVKTRRDTAFGSPEEALTASKLRRLAACAQAWRTARGWTKHPWRLDVIAIDLTGREPVIRHLQGIEL
jgi:putative endonuclease